MIYVVRQPDGTLAQIPTWMCFPDAAAMTVTDRPRIALDALRDLRSVIDAVLPSPFGRTESRVTVENGRKRVTRGFRRDRADWDVLIRDRAIVKSW